MDMIAEDTLLPLEHRPVELGRIRLGAKAVAKSGKEYPTALDTFRLTSAQRGYLDAAAALYGGTVEPWPDAPDEGYFQLLTDSSELRVLIPTSLRTVSQAYELWAGGTCERRCDGTVEQLSDGPCICKSLTDPDAPRCELMTRISIMLPDVPGLGVWRLDTSGWHAATSLPATIALLKQLSTQAWIPAILRLEQRSKRVREDGRTVTHRFAVPVLDLPGLTVGKVIARQANGEAPLLDAGPAPALQTAAERAIARAAAITSGPGTPDGTTRQAGGSASATPPEADPSPADHAAARTVTPVRSPGRAEAGKPTAAPAPLEGASAGTLTPMPDPSPDAPKEATGASTPDEEPAPLAPSEDAAAGVGPPAVPSARCSGFDPAMGRCVRHAGHPGNHQSKEQESWK